MTAAWALALLAASAQADVFLSGMPQGLPGADVDLSIMAGAGTTIESIDIVPQYEHFDQVLTLLSLQGTPALTGGGSGLCTAEACSFFYIQGKSFTADTILATFRFKVQHDAAPGPIDFDLGVTVGAKQVALPESQEFEVLATIPEPSTWLLMLAGFAAVAAGRSRARAVPA